MWVNSHGVFKLFLALVLVLSSTGCEDTNMLETFSNKEDDASLYAAALHHLNKGRYDDAIAVCESMSISQRHGQARFVCASSYAGRCGYSMPGVINMLSGYDPDPDTANPKIFRFLMGNYPGSSTAHIAACEKASTILAAGGTAAERTGDENFLFMLMSLTHVGVTLSTLADTNADNTPDPTFNHCSNVDFPEENVAQVGRAFWNIYRSGEAVNSPITAALINALDEVSTGLDSIDPSYNFLSADADPYNYTANQLKMIRAMVAEGDYVGLNLACSNLAACFMACP